MKRLNFILLLLFITATLNSCEEAYKPKVSSSNVNLLVVDGVIVAGQDSTIINLSRTILVLDKRIANPEVGAIVNVEGENNETFLLQEKSKGIYVSPGLNLDPSKKYRLSIKTAKNVLYKSDFVEVKITPPIDDLKWKLENNGVKIYANTHDDTKKSRYYRWDYTETWKFYSAFESFYKWDGTAVVIRNGVTENIFHCWGNHKSSDILLASTIKLSDDVIFEKPITFIEGSSEKFKELYSILVKQYTLTKEANQFWEELKKNTESLGSIFDAQPSEIKGNIYNVNNPTEPVIGYVSVSTRTEKRIFISKAELPLSFGISPRTDDCTKKTEILLSNFKTFFDGGLAVPIDSPSGPPGGAIEGIKAASPKCVDCTLRGSNKKPSFWP